MTPEGFELDPTLFLNQQPLTLYRLARARYANLSGVGAAVAPGRWNLPGQEAIYTSTEMGVPVLERLAHTPKDLIPSNLAMMRIKISGDWHMHRNVLVDPRTRGCLCFYRDLLTARRRFEIGARLFGEGIDPLAIAVPSVIIPVWNIVLYPKAPGFWNHISLESVDAFKFDPRLFPTNTPVEAAEK